jgi:biopolymer transport protein ExbD
MAGAPSPASAGDEGEPGLISSINVTPFVDVALVLLVIFMVTAPLIAKDLLNLNLPKTVSGDGKGMTTLGIAVNRSGQILLNGQPVTPEALGAEAHRAAAASPQAQAIISGDVEAAYGSVVRAIDIVKTAGLSRFAIQVERDASAAGK